MSTVKVFSKWWRTWGTLPVYQWVKAASLYKGGEFERAAARYEKGLQRFSTHPASFCARMDLAYCLFRLQRFEGAEQQLKQVIAKLPRSREAHLRLAKLYLWTGRTLDAAWTMKRALKSCGNHAELASWYLYCVSENGGPSFLVRDALQAVAEFEHNVESSDIAQAAKAKLAYRKKQDHGEALEALERLVSDEEVELEVLLVVAEVLLHHQEVAAARRHLRRALAGQYDHPRVLSLLAESYLTAGPFYNSSYANQLALQACQNTNWLSPRELHVLAESYYHQDDRISALIIAQKAKSEGSRLMGTYRDAVVLDRLIEQLTAEPVPAVEDVQ